MRADVCAEHSFCHVFTYGKISIEKLICQAHKSKNGVESYVSAAMKKESIEKFIKIPQPPRDSFGFMEDIKKPLEYHFAPGLGCDAGVCAGCMADGAEIIIDHPRNADLER